MSNKLKTILMGLTGATMLATAAHAGGLERSTYPTALIFEEGTYMEGSFAYIMPNITSEVGSFDINPDYSQLSFGFKADLHDRVSVAFSTYNAAGARIIYGAPIGLDIDLSARAYTLTGKVDVASGFSAYAGVAYYNASGETVNLLATGGLPGAISHGSAGGFGWLGGVAYEKPEIALRVSLTFESGANLSLPTTFAALPGTTATTFATIPQALTLDFQSGIAADTLLFGSIRYAWHSGANIFIGPLPPVGANRQITNFSDSTTYTLGLGRKFNDQWSGSISGSYEAANGQPSTFAPTGSKFSLSLGAKYQATEQFSISAGVSHIWLGDNTTGPETGSIPFAGNTAWALGTKFGYRF